MNSTDGITREGIESILIQSLVSILPDLGVVNADTHLIGKAAVLDSVGFVTFLIVVEQKTGQAIDLSASFIELGTAEEAQNPFQTVGSLASYIHGLLKDTGDRSQETGGEQASTDDRGR